MCPLLTESNEKIVEALRDLLTCNPWMTQQCSDLNFYDFKAKSLSTSTDVHGKGEETTVTTATTVVSPEDSESSSL